MLGGFAACCATILAGLAGMLMLGDDAAEITRKLAVLADEAVRGDRPNALLASPVIETLFFLIAFKLLETLRIARQQQKAILALALLMGIVGWLLHDARDAIVAQSFGFAVLGALFAFLWFQSGGVIAFAGTALAHMIWNASLLTLALTYSPRLSWEGRVQHAAFGDTQTDIVGDFSDLDQCRQMSLLHLQRVNARQNAQPKQNAQSRITCERAIRSGR